MDNFSEGFKLVLCDEPIKYRQQESYRKIRNELVKIPSKQNLNIPIKYTWKIYRMISENKEFELCSFLRPTNNIGCGLNEEWVELILNFEKVFEFEYLPQFNDNLILETNEYFSPYISLVFKNSEWKIGYHIPFRYEIEEIFRGQIVEK